jgi:hypothetical protein
MPSQRRMRVFGLLLFVVVVTVLYMTNSADQTRKSAFYVKTQEALQASEYMEAAKQRDADDVHLRLKSAEDTAKKATEEKHKKYRDSVEGGEAEPQQGKSVGGNKFKVQDVDQKKAVPGVATVGGRPRDKMPEKESETPEDHEVEIELNAILKKSPSTLSRVNFPYDVSANLYYSHHLLQILLPALQKSKAHFARQVQHHTCALRRRARHTPSRREAPRNTGGEDRPADSTERARSR